MSTPSLLDQCDRLQAEPYSECTSFSRFVLLRPKKTRTTRGLPPVAALPVDLKFADSDHVKGIERKAEATLKNLKRRLPIVTETPPRPPRRGGGKQVRPVDVAGLGRLELQGGLDKGRRIEAMKNLFPEVTAPAETFRKMATSSEAAKLPPLSANRVIGPIIDAVVSYARLATEAKLTAAWAIGLEYEQCWTSKGYLRGRLVRSLPLTPGEQLEVVIKTWDRRTERRSEVESIERNLSTEVTGEEKWMLATKMMFGDQANASINPSGGVNGDLSVPMESVTANLGGNLGLSGNFSNQLSQSTENGTEYIHGTTVSTARSLQSTRTNSVELSQETGEEISRKQIIANTNRCHTLTYHYFEVLERFEIETRFEDAALHLMIPLPLPEINPEWVLCHECYLRKILPCETLYAGFDAAKTLLSWKKLGELYPPATNPPPVNSDGKPVPGAGGGSYSSPYASAVEALLDRWRIVRNAQLLSLGGPMEESVMSDLAEGAQQVADGLGKVVEEGAEAVGDAIEAGGELIDQGITTVGNALEGLGEAASGFFASTAAPRMYAMSAPQAGAGTWLWNQVAGIAAPQIDEAFAFLETAWPQSQGVPTGDRALAEFNVLQTFFAKLGAPASTFGKVDALFAGAAAAAVGAGGLAGGAVGATGGAIAGAAIAVWGFGVSAVPGAVAGGILGGVAGAGVGAGAVASVLGILSVLEAAGLADTVPDDEGLREAALQVKALLDSQTAMAPAVGMPGSLAGGSEAGTGSTATEMWREQMQTLSDAEIEYQRLACHLKKNLVSYMQGIWGQWPDYQVMAEAARYGVPESVIASRFARFHGALGAIPVVDLDWVKEEGGVDWRDMASKLAEREQKKALTEEMTLSTPGMTVEPALGACEACEPFIRDHRAMDLENRRAEVDAQKARARQESLEADRFQERLDDNQLDDPTPFEGADVSVDVEND